jgi:hypothetical protein
MNTTLNAIAAHEPCEDGWAELLAALGKTCADDAPLSLCAILDSNGLDDAIWALRTITGHDREIRLFAVWCARQVQHLLMTDPLSRDVLDIAERYAHGLATVEELAAAREAAREDAVWGASDAVWSASDAASEAASDAAWVAAWAASAAASDAVRDATSDAARDAVRAAQAVEFRRVFAPGYDT